MSSKDESLQTALCAGLEKILRGNPPDPAAVRRLIDYLHLLCKWNEAYNLTAVRRPEDMVPRHLLDSASVLPWLGGGSLLDAGSGAGLPGIPLAILRPGLKVTLVDSAGKKIRFLRQVIRRLALDNAEAVQERIETWLPGIQFDAVISRAFSNLAAFASGARHLVGPGGRLLAMKGKYPEEDLRKLPAWVRVLSVEKLFVPGLQEERHLVIMSVTDQQQ